MSPPVSSAAGLRRQSITSTASTLVPSVTSEGGSDEESTEDGGRSGRSTPTTLDFSAEGDSRKMSDYVDPARLIGQLSRTSRWAFLVGGGVVQEWGGGLFTRGSERWLGANYVETDHPWAAVLQLKQPMGY